MIAVICENVVLIGFGVGVELDVEVEAVGRRRGVGGPG